MQSKTKTSPQFHQTKVSIKEWKRKGWVALCYAKYPSLSFNRSSKEALLAPRYCIFFRLFVFLPHNRTKPCRLSDRQAYERTCGAASTAELVLNFRSLAVFVDDCFLRHQFLDHCHWNVLRYWFSTFVLMVRVATPAFPPLGFSNAALKKSCHLVTRGQFWIVYFLATKKTLF